MAAVLACNHMLVLAELIVFFLWNGCLILPQRAFLDLNGDARGLVVETCVSLITVKMVFLPPRFKKTARCIAERAYISGWLGRHGARGVCIFRFFRHAFLANHEGKLPSLSMSRRSTTKGLHANEKILRHLS